MSDDDYGKELNATLGELELAAFQIAYDQDIERAAKMQTLVRKIRKQGIEEVERLVIDFTSRLQDSGDADVSELHFSIQALKDIGTHG